MVCFDISEASRWVLIICHSFPPEWRFYTVCIFMYNIFRKVLSYPFRPSTICIFPIFLIVHFGFVFVNLGTGRLVTSSYSDTLGNFRHSGDGDFLLDPINIWSMKHFVDLQGDYSDLLFARLNMVHILSLLFYKGDHLSDFMLQLTLKARYTW